MIKVEENFELHRQKFVDDDDDDDDDSHYL